MNTKVKKGIFWGGIIFSMILVLNVFHYLFGGLHTLAAGPHGHGPRGISPGPNGDFGPHHMLGHHHNGLSWLWFLLFLILGIAVLVLLVKWLRRKSKAAAMQQFIDTSFMSSHTPLTNQSANVLDQWEKSLNNKKENG